MQPWFRTLLVMCMAVLVAAHAWAAPGLSELDLPACEQAAPGSGAGLSIGIVQPHAAEALVRYAARLTVADPNLNLCAETWREVLPRWVPWAPALERGLGLGVFALAFVAAVSVLWFSTPRAWWRRTTLLGVLGVAGLTWLLAVTALALLQTVGAQRLLYDTVVSLRVPGQAGVEWLNLKGARDLEAALAARHALAGAAPTVPVEPPPQAAAPGPDPAASTGPVPAGPYRVAHRLNLRSAPGTQNEWLATLPRGEVLQFDGAVQGDWWRVRRANGSVGWCSSLWLRRPDERLPAMPPAVAEGGAPRS